MIVAGTLDGERAEVAAEVWEIVNGGQAVKPRALGQVLKPGFGAGWRQRRSYFLSRKEWSRKKRTSTEKTDR